MYLRTTQSRLGDGSKVRYLQLAHNHWDKAVGQSRVKVLYNFGREDQVIAPGSSGSYSPSAGSWTRTGRWR